MSDAKTPAARSPALEHAPEATRREAQQLLAGAGNSDEAQRAVESAVGRAATPASQKKDAFAHRWSFGSYLEMFEASKPLSTTDAKYWLVTNVGGRWIVWNDADLSAAYTVGSVQEAQELLGTTAPGHSDKDAPPPTG